MENIRISQNLEVFDIIDFINKKKRLHQKLILNGIEEYMDKDSEDYKVVRKIVLDNTNEAARSIIRAIFGETFEGYIR